MVHVVLSNFRIVNTMETFKDYPSIVMGMNGTKGMKLYISKRSLKQGSIRLAKSPRGVMDRMFRIGNFTSCEWNNSAQGMFRAGGRFHGGG
jgi:hypothetical protein